MPNRKKLTFIRVASLIITLSAVLLLTVLSRESAVLHFTHKIASFKGKEVAVPYEKQTSLSAKIDFLSGELFITPSESETQLLEFSSFYRSDKLRPVIEIGERDVAVVDISSPLVKKVLEDSFWRVLLSPIVPIDLVVHSRAAKQNIDLSGLPLTSLEMRTGTSEMILQFNQANPVPMRELSINAGASDIKVYGLSHANADVIRIHGASGTQWLDFSGAITRTSKIFIEGGVSTTTLRLPKGHNVEMVISGEYNEFVQINGLKKVSNRRYVSQAYNPALPVLAFDVHLSGGQFYVYGF